MVESIPTSEEHLELLLFEVPITFVASSLTFGAPVDLVALILLADPIVKFGPLAIEEFVEGDTFPLGVEHTAVELENFGAISNCVELREDELDELTAELEVELDDNTVLLVEFHPTFGKLVEMKELLGPLTPSTDSMLRFDNFPSESSASVAAIASSRRSSLALWTASGYPASLCLFRR